MPNCQKCNQKWTWKQALKANFKLDGTECPYCGQDQYITAESRRRTNWISFAPALSLLMLAFMDVSLGILISIIIVLSILMIGIYPFVIKLSSDQESFW
ncbi:TIGR04104 family putative zinc finger protein [Oceanobacillus massiliensis]|uniref:TIGR04104 family putative zinc finger protein n=1 Tax=Oceanobacillus massiliensis TaxID=1465765 RepID=UPI00028A2E6D|nr:TIGR04104 family putative zinc finger protein [Oceanobacillus massiliensis]